MARWTGGRAVVGAALVTASLGWAILAVGGGAGAATSVTRHVQSSCRKSAIIPRGQRCQTKTLDPDRSLSVSSETVKVTPTGRGTVAVATYNTDPARTLTSSTGKYFAVSLAVGNAFTNLTVKDCNLGGGTTLYWWTGDTWIPVALEPGSISSATLTCVTVTLGPASSPSLATIVKFSRSSRFQALVFGVK